MNWFRKSKTKPQMPPELTTSILYNEATFYNQFMHDLVSAKEEVVIESPYITTKRLQTLIPVFTELKAKGINIFIITRDPREHNEVMSEQSELGIRWFEHTGIQVLLENGGHHRKLVIIDRKIHYEGSLNILSQAKSREFMRRIESKALTVELFHFLQYDNIFV